MTLRALVVRAQARASTPLVLALLAVGAPPSSALAYSDPERFSAAPEDGGGGGRFFTGSPADGYTCAVCHSGGTSPQVVLRGLPRAGFAPNQLVEAELAFPDGQGNHALALEVVDAAGKDVGLELLSESEITPAERCGAAPGGKRASYLVQVGERRVLGVEACEAKAVRFRFRTAQLDHINIAATALASDNSATVKGDGVTELDETLYRDGSAAQRGGSGCSALSGETAVSRSRAEPRASTHPGWVLLALVAQRFTRRRRC